MKEDKTLLSSLRYAKYANEKSKIRISGATSPEMQMKWCCFDLPAIYLYPEKETNVTVRLNFLGNGFMTKSIPTYNDGWRVKVNPKRPYRKITNTYSPFRENPYVFLDYDGIREGIWQEKEGWQIEKIYFKKWVKETLPTIGFNETEIEDFVYFVCRIIEELEYPEKFFTIYPQTTENIDTSVSLNVDPRPDTIWRLWLYIIPTDKKIELKEPKILPPDRRGFTVIESGFLTSTKVVETCCD